MAGGASGPHGRAKADEEAGHGCRGWRSADRAEHLREHCCLRCCRHEHPRHEACFPCAVQAGREERSGKDAADARDAAVPVHVRRCRPTCVVCEQSLETRQLVYKSNDMGAVRSGAGDDTKGVGKGVDSPAAPDDESAGTHNQPRQSPPILAFPQDTPRTIPIPTVCRCSCSRTRPQ